MPSLSRFCTYDMVVACHFILLLLNKTVGCVECSRSAVSTMPIKESTVCEHKVSTHLIMPTDCACLMQGMAAMLAPRCSGSWVHCKPPASPAPDRTPKQAQTMIQTSQCCGHCQQPRVPAVMCPQLQWACSDQRIIQEGASDVNDHCTQ